MNCCARFPCFKNLPEAALEHIALNLHTRTYAPREIVVEQDTTGDRLYLIAHGVLRLSQERGLETVDIATLMAGDHYGEESLLEKVSNTASIISVTPSMVYVLRRNALENCMKAHSEIHLGVCELDENSPDKQA